MGNSKLYSDGPRIYADSLVLKEIISRQGDQILIDAIAEYHGEAALSSPFSRRGVKAQNHSLLNNPVPRLKAAMKDRFDTINRLGLKDLKNEFKLSNDGDAWGTAMQWAFPLCEVLASRHAYDIPELMEFRAGALGIRLDPECSYTQILSQYKTETLEEFGKILHRLMNILRAQGRTY